jgi:hypothetical protein
MIELDVDCWGGIVIRERGQGEIDVRANSGKGRLTNPERDGSLSGEVPSRVHGELASTKESVSSGARVDNAPDASTFLYGEDEGTDTTC